eukprot:5871919-Pleurochrysis_carterae.AAC.4
MESNLGTIASPAMRPGYRVQCQNSGRNLIRILIVEANASSPSAGLDIDSAMDALLLKGLSDASLNGLNSLHHALTRLNRSLLAHAQLGEALIAEKLCSVVRRVSKCINTILDVKLVMKGATGNLTLSLATIREVLSDFKAREVRRNIELDKPQGRAFIAKQAGQPERTKMASTPHARAKRGDPSRHARDIKGKALSGAWNSNYLKCRHCGETHWHRDCPKRRKATSASEMKGQRSRGGAALASVDASADDKLDAAIGDVLLVS